MENPNHIESALCAGAAATVAHQVGDTPYAVIPENYRLESLESLLPAPTRNRETVRFIECESFIKYVKDFRSAHLRVFAQVEPCPRVLAILDYHLPQKPQWTGHRAILEFMKSKEWERWAQKDRKQMAQTEFLEFLEENSESVMVPDAASLMEMIQDLEGKKNVRFETGVRLQNGRNRLDYQEDIELRGSMGSQKGAIEIPAELQLGISPFKGGSSYAMRARLRYRINDRKLTFWYELVHPDRILDDAVLSTKEEIQKELEVDVLLGNLVC